MSRSIVRTLAPYKPGTSIEEVRRRYGLERVIKLASNENPLGSSPKAIAALASINDLHLYANDTHADLKNKLGARYGLDASHVVLGHGSNELVNLIVQTMLDAGDEAVMATPTFSLYPLAVHLAGGRPVEVPLQHGLHDVHGLLAKINARTKLLFICDPNNPTGTALSADDWQRLIHHLSPHVTLVIDQAYREYMEPQYTDAVEYIATRPKTIVLRTMSKIYGLASLRFGYGYADAETIGWLERVRLPFNVSAPAAQAAWAALDDDQFVSRSIASNVAGKAQLQAGFARLGLTSFPTQANFIAVSVPDSATHVYESLLARGVIVRSGDALHLPGYLRVTIGTHGENQELLRALAEVLA